MASTTVYRSSRAGKRQACAWETNQDQPTLPGGELHLWWMPLSAAPGVVDRLSSLLSGAELARAARFRFDRHRTAYILGRATLRRLIQGYTGIPVADLAFRTGPRGKPALDVDSEADSLSFNYSDAGGYALYGFVRDVEIGVDLESLDREVGYEGIARKKFSTTEAAAIFALPEEMRKDAFLACWTRKEGYGKAQGWGINYPLHSVELCADCDNEHLSLAADDGNPGNWTLRQIYPTRSFVGCVVYPADLDSGAGLKFRYFGTRPDAIPRR